ncbi:MAG: InlB B-repeat-containing protein, partial [Bacteroidales bacterium]|nr:InlB B-repeat-containing protein [Bacteroidales bacterium]
GTTVTLTATANDGYTFVNWTKNGEVVSNTPVFSITVTESAAYVANFNQNGYEITATANPTNGGTVTGASTYGYGETCTLTATANSGYVFVNWTKNGTVVSTTPTFSFTVTESASYVAHFSVNSYEITATANPDAGGTTTGSGTYGYGATCTLSATANPGYTFVNWTKNGTVVSNASTFSITVTESATYVAHFNLNSYVITTVANPEVGGTTTGSGAYNYGTTVTLTATANESYTFVNWTKDGEVVSTTSAFSVTVTESATYVANFSLNSYEITAMADPADAGTVTGAGTYSHGSTVILTATANNGYTFDNWTKNGNVVSTNATYSFTALESADYVAHFVSSTHVVTTGVNPANGGQASGDGTYPHGASCTVVATPNDGYTFVKWMQDGVQVSTQPSYTFTVVENTHLTAYFTPQNCTITAEASPVEGGEISGAGVYEYGEACTLIATPNADYVFVKWMKDGVQVSTDAHYSFTVTGNAHYTAVFASNVCVVTASADPEEGGTITGAGTYTYGQTVTLTVTPNENYQFINWTENGEIVSEDETYSFEVTGNRNLVAHLMFVSGVDENHNVDISIYPNPTVNKVTVEASQIVNKWEIFTISGSLVYSSSECTDKKEFWVSQLAPGTYVIRMTIDNEVLTREFVKKR